MENILPTDKIGQLGKYLKQQRQKVVLAGGCFDLLHFGHISFLQEAKAQGDILIVLLESDKRIKDLKGSDRPLHTQIQRAKMLASIKTVDYIILLPSTIESKDYDVVVNQLQPAIIATTRGSDSLHYITRQADENNATVYFAEPIPNLSTSRIVAAVTKEL